MPKVKIPTPLRQYTAGSPEVEVGGATAGEALGNLATRTEDAYEMVKRVAREDGILIGISAGAAVATALRVARELDSGTIVTILCDGADKYLSESFWEE